MSDDDNDALIRGIGADTEAVEDRKPTRDPASAKRNIGYPISVGHQIAMMLESGGYHPVIVVGTTSAGKTTLLASLLARVYATNEETAVDFQLAKKPLFPADHPLCEAIWIETRQFYEGTVTNFSDFVVAAATRFEHPFYVPIHMVPKTADLPEAKFAFLECRGEVFDPELAKAQSGAGQLFMSKEMPEFITGVLHHFKKGISFIYVAPGGSASEMESKRIKADRSLLSCMEKIQGIRVPAKFSPLDKHLYLISMWDECTGGIGAEGFERHHIPDIEKLLVDRFKKSWGKYRDQRSESEGSHRFMPYSAGPFSADGQITSVALDSYELLNRYPRTVLNWLYENALGRSLFPDVIRQPVPPPTLLERLMQFVSGQSFARS